MKHFASVVTSLILVALAAMLGCDDPSPAGITPSGASPSPVYGSPTPTPSPAPVGDLQGQVLDRDARPLAGAFVTLGGHSVYTLTTAGSQNDSVGHPVAVGVGGFLLSGVPSGPQTLLITFDGASRSVPVTVVANVVTQLNSSDLQTGAAGPVAAGSRAIDYATTTLASNSSAIFISRASGSASLVFSPDQVVFGLKSPPNGVGETIHAYSWSFIRDGVTLSRLGPWTLTSPVTVPAASDAAHSGAIAAVPVPVLNSTPAMLNAWDLEHPIGIIRFQFYADDASDSPPITGRDGNPLVVTVPFMMVP